jgi:hypothetical protein
MSGKNSRSKKRLKIVILSIAGLAIVLNVAPFFSAFDIYDYSNKSETFCFREYPAQNTNLQMMQMQFQSFKDTTSSGDTILYRRFKINPFYFWQWREFVFNPRYKYPYLELKSNNLTSR